MDWREPSLAFRARLDSDKLQAGYEVTNNLAVPIYVFDQLYDMKSEKLAENWSYIEVMGTRVVLSRQIAQLPTGLHHENPEVPYARVLNPGGKLTTVFTRPLPLAETDPYFHIRNRNRPPQTYQPGDDLVFRLGWAVAADLHGGVPVEINGAKLVLFPYEEAIGKQRLINSQPIRPDALVPARM
jgi:hypothetical protein